MKVLCFTKIIFVFNLYCFIKLISYMSVSLLDLVYELAWKMIFSKSKKDKKSLKHGEYFFNIIK